ncbi:hypothetical protein PROFUN_15397 [Planoprotostelium fungivorum]|uniref:Uncharacterized protein n=1 Tax=Planoprotostelium fungivorum TaxID=1890364 RepID=A0A2P6MVF9_9EUKA|nr:hypothetical protein PROFUN_15397 [Planoprotostelium fungivorum]
MTPSRGSLNGSVYRIFEGNIVPGDLMAEAEEEGFSNYRVSN